jgi:hypothetical protein
LDNRIGIPQRFNIAKTQHTQCHLFQSPRASRVVVGGRPIAMLSPVQFDDQIRLETYEINDVSGYRMLPPTAKTGQLSVAEQ